MYKLRDKQKELVDILIAEEFNKLLVYATPRVGKTLAMLDYIKKTKVKSVLWLANDARFRDIVFDSELKKFKLTTLRKKITVICDDSLKHHVSKYDLIIFDECHNITENIYKYLLQCNYDKLILMTGTIPNKRSKLELLDKLDVKLVFTYTNDEAVENNDVADYNISIIHHSLNKDKNIRIDYAKNGKSFSFFTSEIGQYNSISNKIATTMGEAKKRASLFRMRLCNEFPSRIQFIKEYIQRNNNKRFLIFVSSRAIAEQFPYYYIGTSSDVHYNAFAYEIILYLVLVEKGGTGHTYENLDGCLLASINSSNVITTQKIMRSVVFRNKYIANIDILVNKNTIQVQWITEALADLNSAKIKHIM